MKVVIIGGVAGGATAAARLRRLDESAEIIVIERSGYVSYANCGLPYYIGGEIRTQDALTLQTPQSFFRRFAIDVRVRQEAISIDPDGKTVTVKRLEDGSFYVESYDKLLLSPGAAPLIPPIPGAAHPRVFTLRAVEDAVRIRAFVAQERPRRAVVVGGGFIGLEMAENLTRAGCAVTLVERLPQLLTPLDADMASFVHAYLQEQGVELRLSAAVARLDPQPGGGLTALLESGEALPADLVLLAAGVRPDTALAQKAGLALGERGAIVVDAHMRTSAPDIYAVGDAVQIRHIVTGRPALISLAGPANRQGRIAADHICGRESAYAGAQGSSILKLFDMTVASTGLNQTAAAAAGFACDAVVTDSPSHATYYPGARNLTLKLVFEKESGRVLGAQIVGFEGVDKRIDVLATALRAGMTARDLTELDLAYAPPFSSAKDPVNMAGYVAENVLDGLVRQLHWHELEKFRETPGAAFLDVRTEGEFQRGHIPGAVNIPLDALRGRLQELDPQAVYCVNCHSGLRSYIACRILAQRGFSCYNFSGGYRLFAAVEQDRASFDPTHACGLPLRD